MTDNIISDDLATPVLRYGVHVLDGGSSGCSVARNAVTTTNGSVLAELRLPTTGWANDPQPTVAFTAAASSCLRTIGSTSLAVQLSASQASPVTVQYAILPLSAGGTATADDVTLAAGTLTFATGQTTAAIPLTIADNAANSTGRTVVVRLKWPTGAWLGAVAQHTLTIQPNTSGPPTSDNPDPPTGGSGGGAEGVGGAGSGGGKGCGLGSSLGLMSALLVAGLVRRRRVG